MRSPFDSTHVDEVPLAQAPLIRVLSQVRWPPLVQLRNDLSQVAAEFGRKIFSEYPIYGEQKEIQVVITPEGANQQATGTLFQFKTADDIWRATLSDSFLSLETREYTSKDDFCQRFANILEALLQVVRIPHSIRVGFRYVNRIDDPEIYSRVGDLVNPIVMGGGSVPLVDGAGLMHSVCESVYAIGEYKLLTRWAHVPAGGTTDPTIESSPNPSWTLDLDSFTEGRFDFDPTKIVNLTEQLSAVSYKFFRWAVTDEFLRVFGGDV